MNGRQVCPEQLGEPFALQVQMRDELVEPGASFGVRGNAADHAEVSDVVADMRGHAAQLGRRTLGAGDGERALETRKVPGLARADEREPVLGDLEVGHVRRTRQRHRRVHLVRDHEQVVPGRELRYRGELLARVDRPRRVVRAAEEVAARTAGERGGERVEIEAPVGAERRLDDLAAYLARNGEERRIDGRVHDHGVARRRQRPQQLGDARHDVRDDERSLRVDLPAPARGRERRERLGQSPWVGVTRVVAVDRLGERAPHGWCEREVELGDPGRQHIGRVAAPLLAAALPQLLQREVVERGGRRHGRPP